MAAGPDDAINLHASCVSVSGRGCLILGASGRGKSALALELISRGARLVADDRVDLRRAGDAVLAAPPAAIAGRIEARGVGILSLPFDAEVPVALVVDLDSSERDRLPQPHRLPICGLDLPCLHDPEMGHFPAAILAYLSTAA